MSGVFRLAEGAELILASASPRRRILLGSLGVPFATVAPEAEEPAPESGEAPDSYALRMAELKAARCQRIVGQGKAIVAADTIVCLGERVFGKPRDAAEAHATLRELNGRAHIVATGVCCILPGDSGGETHGFVRRSLVKFGDWPDAVLHAYANSGDALDKAGAYALQDTGAFLIEEIQGSWTNVVGLPLEELTRLFLRKKIIIPA